MLDIKVMKSALEQLEEERKIPKEKIIEAIEQAVAAAYKKDYGKKGQIVRTHLDMDTGALEFSQVKIVVDDTLVKMPKDEDEEGEEKQTEEIVDDGDERAYFNPEHHIWLEDAKKIKSNVKLEEEIIFPLEMRDDFGRIAAQTAKQVIIQRIREAERESIVGEYGEKEGEIVSGIVQKIEHGDVFVDFNRTVGVIPFSEQIPNEHYRRGERIRAYLYMVEETPRGVNLRLSRTHPKFLEKLFEMEAPEIASGVVEIKSVAREPGSRSKIAVKSNDEHIEPVGSCVGQRGVRVSTVMNELGGEKIDLIEWSDDPKKFVSSSLSPAKVLDIEIDENLHRANVEVAEDHLSLAIGKGGQNVRLAAKLTGWKIDINGVQNEEVASDEDKIETDNDNEEIDSETLEEKFGSEQVVDETDESKEGIENITDETDEEDSDENENKVGDEPAIQIINDEKIKVDDSPAIEIVKEKKKKK